MRALDWHDAHGQSHCSTRRGRMRRPDKRAGSRQPRDGICSARRQSQQCGRAQKLAPVKLALGHLLRQCRQIVVNFLEFVSQSHIFSSFV